MGIDEFYEGDFHICQKQNNVITARATWSNEEIVEEFLQYMNDRKHVYWRALRTYSNMSQGTHNVFYKEFRCQNSNSQIKSNTQKPHPKHTDCKVEIRITIKRTGHRCR